MDLRKIKKLIDLLEESNLAEIEIKEGEESVRLARTPKGGYAMAPPQPVYAPAPEQRPAQAMPMSSPTEAATGGSAKPAGDLPDGHVVRAPAQQGGAAGFAGEAGQPQHVLAVERELGQRHGAGGDHGGADRGSPGAAGRGLWAGRVGHGG